jgi:3-dehydroquinate synthetase
LPLDTANLKAEDIIKHLVFDKKNQKGIIKYIYLKDIGNPIYNDELNIEDFKEIWQLQKELFG